MSAKTTIGIALSGGGPRGVAHIGALQALSENGIVADVVAGTSAGAIVGALHCAGKTTDEMLDFAKQFTLYKFLKFGFPNGGVMTLKALKDKLLHLIPENSFEKLEKPLHVVVTNLNVGEEEIVSSGKLIDFIIASSAVPLVFESVEINGINYADGGLMNNLPANVLHPICDMVIGINVMPHINVSSENLNSLMGVGMRTFDLAIWSNTKFSIPYCDVVIEPKALAGINMFNTDKLDFFYEVGYNEALKHIDQIKMYLK